MELQMFQSRTLEQLVCYLHPVVLDCRSLQQNLKCSENKNELMYRLFSKFDMIETVANFIHYQKYDIDLLLFTAVAAAVLHCLFELVIGNLPMALCPILNISDIVSAIVSRVLRLVLCM